jgi:hypothetical protein
VSGWFYNSASGSLNRVPTALEPPYLIPGIGWHELKIPYSASRDQAIADAKKEYPQGAPPGGKLKDALGHDLVSGAGLAPLASVGDFFHRLSEKQTWIRVGEVVGGGILLFIGVRALASGSPTVGSGARKAVTKPVSRTAKRAITVAAPEVRLGTRVAAKRVAPKTTARVTTHRAKAAKYGARKPYQPPAPRQATVRVSHIYHHAQKKPVSLKKVRKP